MTALRARRFRFLVLALLATTAVVVADRLYAVALRDPAFLDGWLLLGGMVFLIALNLRKKLRVLPLFPAAAWLQAHIYVGLLSAVLFLVHSKLRLPDGPLESLLWGVTLLLLLSGFAGLVLSRALPARITAAGERLIFERLPACQAELAARVRELAIGSAMLSGTGTIVAFHTSQLSAHFGRSRGLWDQVVRGDAPYRKLCRQIDELARYHEPDCRRILEDIRALAGVKRDLDRQYALQLVLKAWLFLHVPLAYGVLPIALAHVATAYAFSSGAP